MIYVTFNGGLVASLRKRCPQNLDEENILMLFLPLEIGNIETPENSKANEVFYDVLAGKNAYLKFKAELDRTYLKIKSIPDTEEICFWVDFNDVRQYLNFAYFLKCFERFKNKTYISFDFNLYCDRPDAIYEFTRRKRVLDKPFEEAVKFELRKVQKDTDKMFRSIVNDELVSVNDDHFDKYIYAVVSERPKKCMQIISEIFAKFGRLAMSFDQIVIRLWLLLRAGEIERVGAKTERDMFFDYSYKLASRTLMERD